MAEQIKDGTGKGYLVKVNEKNQLLVEAITWSGEHNICHEDEEAYSVYFNVTPTGASDVFLYMKNTSAISLCITSINIYTPSLEAIDIYLDTSGTPVGGSTNTPNNRTSSSSKEADATVQHGVDITGLTVGNIVDRMYILGNNGSQKLSWNSQFVLPSNTSMCIAAVNGAINIVGTLSINFHEHI